MTTYGIRIPVTIVGLVALGFEPHLTTCERHKVYNAMAVGW